MGIEASSFIDRLCALGARTAAVLPVRDIVFDRRFRELCAQNSCGNYGKCWMCPPDAGDIDVLIAKAKGFDKALVYQTVGALEDSYDFDGMMAAAKEHNILAQKITEQVCAMGPGSFLHLGSGGCRYCDVCAKRTDEPCRFPDRAMASLETYGVAVSELAAACGMNYINGQNTVTYFGAVFYME